VQEHVKREKQIMAECDCPFMVNLVTSFKDGTYLYMLMECVMGGELFTYLQSRPAPLKEDHARFYAASVVLGLEYMQERSIMWRCAPPARRTPFQHACRSAASCGGAPPPARRTPFQHAWAGQ
jgi:cGMP-dependent protein kinase